LRLLLLRLGGGLGLALRASRLLRLRLRPGCPACIGGFRLGRLDRAPRRALAVELADLDHEVREALRERHRPALRTRAIAEATLEQRAVVGATLRHEQAVHVDRLV